MSRGQDELTPELLVHAYLQGAFPMANHRQGSVSWFSPDPRAILPIEPDDPAGAFHIPRRLARTARQQPFLLTRNRAFAQVIAGCAAPRTDESETWISPAIEHAFLELHHQGLAHSIEAWRPADDSPNPETRGPEIEGAAPTPQLVGGLYGLALGRAFFAESMFSRATDASKLCLVHLVQTLRDRGFTLLDVQFVNDHLQQFGVAEITRDEYLERLQQATHAPPNP